jgi:hypothetical protein
MHAPYPTVGDWYRINGGELFEVVAFDEDDGTLELQHFDGTIEEMELDDWIAQADARLIENAEPPEDWSGSLDVDQLELDNDDQERSTDAANSAMFASWDSNT